MKHRVRVTQEPGVVREVDDGELLDLGRQGLLHSFDKTDEAKIILADVPTSELKGWKDPEHKADVVTAPDPAGATAPADNTKGK